MNSQLRINSKMDDIKMHVNEKSKTSATKSAYHRVVERIRRHAMLLINAGELGVDSDPNLQLALAYLDLEPTLQAASARYYLAAVLHEIECTPGDNDEQVIDLLKPEISEAHLERQHRIAAYRSQHLKDLRGAQQRATHLSESDWSTLLAAILQSRSKWSKFAAAWLICTRETGLRPIECLHAKFIGTVLLVVNAKTTNGRSHGPTRSIDLRLSRLETVEIIRQFLDAVSKHCQLQEFKNLYHGVRDLIASVGRRVLSKRKRYPSLYTARHCFASRAKSTLPADAVAALMGHASIYSAPKYYAAARYASGGVPLAVEPGQADLEAVRRLEAARQAKVSMQMDGAK